MTRKQAQKFHNNLVEKRKAILKTWYVRGRDATEKEIKEIDRQIGVYGNAFNHRISEKARLALALED